MDNKKKEYFNEMNVMRGMAVICVVIGHSFNPTNTPTVLGYLHSFVYCFHMPAFFFISGFLTKNTSMNNKDKIKKIKKKAQRLLIPYLSLTIVTIILKVIFGAFARNSLDYDTLFVDILLGQNNPNGGLWFLYALFIISSIGIALMNVNKYCLAVIAFILHIMNSVWFKQDGNILGFILIYSCYYFGGMVVRILYPRIKGCINSVSIVTIVSVMYMFLAYIRIYIVDIWYYTFFITIAGIFVLFLTARKIEKKTKVFWSLETIGFYGMDIYMIGYYVQQAVYVILGKILGIDYVIYSGCMCIAGLILPIVISKYIVKKNSVLSFLILGEKIEK